MILVGVIHENKAYCRVLEFADELDISTTFNPFKLHDIKGDESGEERPHRDHTQPRQTTGEACDVDQEIVAAASRGVAVIDEQIGARDGCPGGHHHCSPVGSQSLVTCNSAIGIAENGSC